MIELTIECQTQKTLLNTVTNYGNQIDKLCIHKRNDQNEVATKQRESDDHFDGAIEDGFIQLPSDVLDKLLRVLGAEQTIDVVCDGPTARQESSTDVADSPFTKKLSSTESSVDDIYLFETLHQLPEETKASLFLLIQDLQKKEAVLNISPDTGHVLTKYKISPSARIPEKTLKMVITSHSQKKSQLTEVETCCDMIDYLKEKKPSAGVSLDSREIKPSRSGIYRSDVQFKMANVLLGEGLSAKVHVTVDQGTGKRHAFKPQPLHSFNTNEIRAMYQLNESGITPILFGFQLDRDTVQLFMEVLEDSVSMADLINSQIDNNIKHCCPELLPIFSVSVLHMLIRAAEYIQANGWAHCDLHAGNIFLQWISGGELKVRLIDLGSSVPLASLSAQRTMEICANDFCHIMKNFYGLSVGGEWFENMFEFRHDYSEKLKTLIEMKIITPDDSSEIMDILSPLLEKNYLLLDSNVKTVMDLLDARLSQLADINKTLTKVLGCLTFSQLKFIDLHPDA